MNLSEARNAISELHRQIVGRQPPSGSRWPNYYAVAEYPPNYPTHMGYIGRSSRPPFQRYRIRQTSTEIWIIGKTRTIVLRKVKPGHLKPALVWRQYRSSMLDPKFSDYKI